MCSININIRMSTGTKFTISTTTSSTISQIKHVIANDTRSGECPPQRQRLIHKGRILNNDNHTLIEYGILDSNQTIHLVKSSASVGAVSVSGAVSATTNTTTTADRGHMLNNNTYTNNNSNNNSNHNNYSNTNAATNTNPFAAMMSNNNNNNHLGMTPPTPEQLLQNPEQLSSLMNSPMMQSIMNNPDFLRTMMESNPQMRQLMESNPELRHLLDDPELMRRSMEMMRDPSAMQNMMRNQDLAMSQIENVPGGFSALRRMYEDVQAPMMDAMASGSENGVSGNGNGNGNGENVNSGAAGTAMPNPWATPAQNQSSSVGGGVNTNMNMNTNMNTNMNMNMNMNMGSSNSSSNSGNAANPFAAMAGANANANANPFAAMAGINANANPWANMAGGNVNANAGNSPEMPNMEQTVQMLENPMIHQMMESLMSDPAAMQSVLQSNPMLRQMTQANPQVAQMLNNPEMMRTMMNPSNLRSMMQMQNSMQGMGGFGRGDAAGAPSIPAGVPPPNFAAPGLDFSTLLNQMQSTSIGNSGVRGSGIPMQGMGGGNGAAPIPPEQRFRIQLQSLNDMGFDDNQVNIPALVQTHGNVNRAIDMLLTNPPAPVQSSVPAAAAMGNSDISGSAADGGHGQESMDLISTSEDNADENVEPKDPSTKKND